MSTVAQSILILDDDPIFRAVTGALLRKRLGLIVVEAPTVEHALALVRETPHLSLIVCDLNLPDADGIEFVTILAEADIQCPLLFVSGAVKAVAKAAAPLAQSHGLTVIGTLPKPLDHDAFIDAVVLTMNKCL